MGCESGEGGFGVAVTAMARSVFGGTATAGAGGPGGWASRSTGAGSEGRAAGALSPAIEGTGCTVDETGATVRLRTANTAAAKAAVPATSSSARRADRPVPFSEWRKALSPATSMSEPSADGAAAADGSAGGAAGRANFVEMNACGCLALAGVTARPAGAGGANASVGARPCGGDEPEPFEEPRPICASSGTPAVESFCRTGGDVGK